MFRLFRLVEGRAKGMRKAAVSYFEEANLQLGQMYFLFFLLITSSLWGQRKK